MKKNMGTVDRTVRMLLAILVGVLYFTDVITGTAAVILGVFAIIFLGTGLISTCPLYIPFGLSTRKQK